MGRGRRRRRTWNNGAWCAWHWTTTSARPTATLLLTNPTPGSAVSYFLDGALTDNVPVPSSGGITITGLNSPGPHTLTVYTRNSRQDDRWRGLNSYTVTGLTLDDGATPTPAPPLRPWVLIVGDSITEGIQADDGADNSLRDCAFLVGQGLNAAGFDYAASACGYSGWLRPGDAQGDVPAAQILVLVPSGLADARVYPNGPAYIAALKAGFTAYHAASPTDRRTVLVDLGPDVALASPAYGGGVHPHAAGHAYLAPLVLQALLRRLRP